MMSSSNLLSSEAKANYAMQPFSCVMLSGGLLQSWQLLWFSLLLEVLMGNSKQCYRLAADGFLTFLCTRHIGISLGQ